VISVFKRQFLNMLGDKMLSNEAITNGKAWSLIPYAWSHMKEATLRHCFMAAGVLPPELIKAQEQIDFEPPDSEIERKPLSPPAASETDGDENDKENEAEIEGHDAAPSTEPT
ncbi:hypothetical protein DFQ26_002309, partial [Actinomortierella ambigua]